MNELTNTNLPNSVLSVGIVGVRGYVGRELINLLANQSNFRISWVSSRQLAGVLLSDLLEDDEKFNSTKIGNKHYYHQMKIDSLSSDAIAALETDIVILALPNGLAKDFVSKLEQANTCKVIIDLSADYRFDDSWIYSVPELDSIKFRKVDSKLELNQPIKISNPGCYATAMQVAIAPLLGKIRGQVNCFGISGYSGAGTTPTTNNDPENLKDNILPYGLVEHIHEKEVCYQLNQPVFFSPHVASFFRGISMTIQIDLKSASSEEEINKIFSTFYKKSSNINVVQSIPNIQQVSHTHLCSVGGFKLSKDGMRLTLISCLDNLLKGAASQALQNIALACQLNIEFDISQSEYSQGVTQ